MLNRMAATNYPLLQKLLAHSVETANMAGSIIRNILKEGDLKVVDKGQNDPQTEADRSAQRCIMASLLAAFPNVKVIGEEGDLNLNIPKEWLVTSYAQDVLVKECQPLYTSMREEDVVVWVDPLDGTQEFTQGNLDCVTVLIGIAVSGKAVGGVIHQPFYEKKGRTIWGLKGLGVSGIDVVNPPGNRFVITTTRSHADANVISAINNLGPDEILRVGGAGFKVLQLLNGSANAYIFASPGSKKWDTCAPEAILEIAGGVLTDVSGNHYNYNQNTEHRNKLGVIATAVGVNHSELINRIPDEIKNKLMQ